MPTDISDFVCGERSVSEFALASKKGVGFPHRVSHEMEREKGTLYVMPLFFVIHGLSHLHILILGWHQHAGSRLPDIKAVDALGNDTMNTYLYGHFAP